MQQSVDICDQSILITGGTGSFGKSFVKSVLDHCPKIKRLVVYSRDELKQFEMQQEFPQDKYPALRFFIGDVRDRDRLIRAFARCDVVVHAAALKRIEVGAYNPLEMVKTNVDGATNVIEAAQDARVSRVVFRQKGDDVGIFRKKEAIAAVEVEFKVFDIQSGREILADMKLGEVLGTSLVVFEDQLAQTTDHQISGSEEKVDESARNHVRL